MAQPFELFGQGRILRSLPGTARGRRRFGIYVSDWENVPEGLIGESWISENFFALRNAVEDLSDTEQEAFFVWCNYKCHDLSEEDADDLIKAFQDEYIGQYEMKKICHAIVAECYELPDFAETYFDYQRFRP